MVSILESRSGSAPPPLTGRLPGLDVLRGVAALCVLAFHASIYLSLSPAIGAMGYLAVDFFFMLSGYVMARTYEHRFAQGYRARRFLWARYRRLWPVMAVGTLIGAPLVLLDLHFSDLAIAAVIANLLLLPAINIGVLYPANGAAWSILGELIANVVHGAVGWRMRQSAIALGALALFAVLAWLTIHAGTLGDLGPANEHWFGGIIRALFSYSIGILLFRIWRDKPPLRIPPFLVFLTMPVLFTLGGLLEGDAALFDLAFVVIACPLLIAGGLGFTKTGELAHWLGQISFPLYAVHLPLLQLSRGLGLGPVAAISTILALSFLLALLTDRGAGRSVAAAAA